MRPVKEIKTKLDSLGKVYSYDGNKNEIFIRKKSISGFDIAARRIGEEWELRFIHEMLWIDHIDNYHVDIMEEFITDFFAALSGKLRIRAEIRGRSMVATNGEILIDDKWHLRGGETFNLGKLCEFWKAKRFLYLRNFHS